MTENRNNGGPSAGDRYQHWKGGTYEVVAIGKMQADDWYEHVDELARYPVDMTEVVVYRSETDGLIWVRPLEKFMDGRFTLLATRSSSKEA